jgi:hypothetical protein
MNRSPAYLEWREATLQEGQQETLQNETRGLLEAKLALPTWFENQTEA